MVREGTLQLVSWRGTSRPRRKRPCAARGVEASSNSNTSLSLSLFLSFPYLQRTLHSQMTPSTNSTPTLEEPFPSALAAIRAKLPAALATPKWGIICGSGLAGLGDRLEEKVLVPYSDIPVSEKCSGVFLAAPELTSLRVLLRASHSPLCKVTNQRLPLDSSSIQQPSKQVKSQHVFQL